ncbi:MAG: PilN domain-containing protein [Deltaproteobacteria bacterium]|nr:PilN domain-containing protein [Deltaproteobacteria bacterium]
MTIQRINLLEKKQFRVTYGLLLSLFLGMLTLSLLMAGTAWFGQFQAQTHVTLLQTDISKLQKERERLMAKGEMTEAGPLKELLAILEREPDWSQLLRKISKALPPNVWLASFKSFDREGSGIQKSIILNGWAKKAKDLAGFMGAIEKDPYFEKVVLTSSKKEDSLFNFSITCDITARKHSQ